MAVNWWLMLLGLHIAVVAPNPFVKLIHANYEVAKKYVCVNKMDLFFERPILFSYGESFINGFPGVTTFYCDMSVVSRSKHTGILATVQRLNFRMSNPTTCYDWLRYDRDHTQRCGESHYGTHLFPGGKFPPPPRVSMYSGPFLAGTSWAESSDLVPKGNIVQPGKTLNTHVYVHSGATLTGMELSLVIAYTGFIECDNDNVPNGWFNCGYGVCISRKLLYDGVVNCPFGDCIDEGSCEDAEKKFKKVTEAFNQRIPPNTYRRKRPARVPRSIQPDGNYQCPTTELMNAGNTCNTTAYVLDLMKNELGQNSAILNKVSHDLVQAV